MIIKVQYRNDKTGEYSGNAYAYETDLDVSIGDIVTAPTYKGDCPAKVCETHILTEALPPFLLQRLLTITNFYTEEMRKS